MKTHGVLKDADLFDATFFNMSATEAERTDPQHRMFLEQCFIALQLAGYDPEQFKSLIGVYAGTANNLYVQNNVLPGVDWTLTSKYLQILIGNDKDFLATRVSYKLNP